MLNSPFIAKLRQAWNNTGKIYKLEWILLTVMFLILFCSYNYWDLIITTRHSINFWTALFDGEIMDFYHINYNPPITHYTTSYAIYPFPVYIIFALWDFPLWLLERFFSFDPFTSRLALLYAKSLLIPALFGTCVVFYKLGLQLKLSASDAKWCVFYFVSSLFVLSSLSAIGQYDVFSLFFTLLGFLYYLKKSDGRFLLFFALAISCKMFALFVFIPLLLLRFKKIYQILAYGICGLSLYLLSSALFSMPEESKERVNDFIGWLVSNRLPLMVGGVPVFIIAMVCLWIFCYAKKTEDDWMPVYIIFASFAVFFICVYSHPYWNILIGPFICLFVMKNSRYLKLNVILETAGSAFWIFYYMITHPWCYDMYTINSSLLAEFFGDVTAPEYLRQSIGYQLKKLLDNDALYGMIAPVCLGAFAACLLALLVVNYRLLWKEQASESGISAEFQLGRNTRLRTMLWIRTVLNFGLLCLPICMFLFLRLTGQG